MQQAEMLRINTSLTVVEVTGDDSSCGWTQEEWLEAWAKGELFVMTPAVFVNTLSRAFVPARSPRLSSPTPSNLRQHSSCEIAARSLAALQQIV